jgi:hypothetical protein
VGSCVLFPTAAFRRPARSSAAMDRRCRWAVIRAAI